MRVWNTTRCNLGDLFALGLLPGRAKERIYLEGPKLSFCKLEELASRIAGLDQLGLKVKEEGSAGSSSVSAIGKKFSPGNRFGRVSENFLERIRGLAARREKRFPILRNVPVAD